MRATPDVKTVGGLLELKKEELLYANPEYQRGVVWTPAQKKRLVDSVMRGYPIPLIYLHHIKKTVAGISNERFEISTRPGVFSSFDDTVVWGIMGVTEV